MSLKTEERLRALTGDFGRHTSSFSRESRPRLSRVALRQGETEAAESAAQGAIFFALAAQGALLWLLTRWPASCAQNYFKLGGLAILFHFCYFLVYRSDPGLLTATGEKPPSVIQAPRNADGVPLRWCDICELWQPLRAKHCDKCSRCVRKYDHHCFWVACCVGERNHIRFMLMLCSAVPYLGYATWCAFCRTQLHRSWSLDQTLLYNVLPFGLTLTGTAMLFFVLVLVGMHGYFLATNQTSWDTGSSRGRITFLYYAMNSRPFDRGVIRNVWEACRIGQPTEDMEWRFVLPPRRTEV